MLSINGFCIVKEGMKSGKDLDTTKYMRRVERVLGVSRSPYSHCKRKVQCDGLGVVRVVEMGFSIVHRYMLDRGAERKWIFRLKDA